VKSVSEGRMPPSAAFSQLQASAGRAPQEHVAPVTLEFSVDARSQVHSPAGRAPVNMKTRQQRSLQRKMQESVVVNDKVDRAISRLHMSRLWLVLRGRL